jgi:hypothetical protein
MRLMLLLSRAADDSAAAAAAAAVGGPTGDEPVNPVVSDMLHMNRDTDDDEGLLFQHLYRHHDDQQKREERPLYHPPPGSFPFAAFSIQNVCSSLLSHLIRFQSNARWPT